MTGSFPVLKEASPENLQIGFSGDDVYVRTDDFFDKKMPFSGRILSRPAGKSSYFCFRIF